MNISKLFLSFFMLSSSIVYATGNTGNAGLDSEKSGSSNTSIDMTEKAEHLDKNNNYEKTKQTAEKIKSKSSANGSDDSPLPSKNENAN